MGINAAVRILAAFLAFVELGADELAEFTFNHAVMFMGVIDDAFADLDVFIEIKMAAVDHDASETFIDALFAKLEAVPVIEVDRDGDGGEANGGFDKFFEIDGVGILPGAFGNLEHDGRFFLFASLDDSLEELHVVYVKSAEGVLSLKRFGKQICRMCQWHISI